MYMLYNKQECKKWFSRRSLIGKAVRDGAWSRPPSTWISLWLLCLFWWDLFTHTLTHSLSWLHTDIDTRLYLLTLKYNFWLLWFILVPVLLAAQAAGELSHKAGLTALFLDTCSGVEEHVGPIANGVFGLPESNSLVALTSPLDRLIISNCLWLLPRSCFFRWWPKRNKS